MGDISIARPLEALKVPPHSIEAEQGVLGGILLDNAAWEKVVEVLQANDFYRYDHRILFQSIDHLMSQHQPVDVITLSERLTELKKIDEVGGLSYLIELAKNTPGSANVAAYAEIVRDRSILRQLVTVGHEITENAFTPKGRSVLDLLDEAERRVFAIAEQGVRHRGVETIKTLLVKAIERIETLFHAESHITGLSSGFADLDHLTAGLQPADLIIVAGRPSMGKTTFALNLVESVIIEAAKPVLVFSMEMPGVHLATRLLSSLGRIEQQRLRTGKLLEDEWPRLSSAISILSDKKLLIDDTPGLSPAEVRARARRVAREYQEIGMIVIDYLQLMQVPGNKENRTAEISEISRSLKLLAKELNVPVIALSQLNRELEHRPNKRPIMSDLRESGAIEQDADLIAFIYRDEVYNKESPDKGIAEILIAKQRNGPTGMIKLAFRGQYCRFENYAENQVSYDM